MDIIKEESMAITDGERMDTMEREEDMDTTKSTPKLKVTVESIIAKNTITAACTQSHG